MVSNRDLMMYLLAAKSLCQYLNRAQIIVINDGSLTTGDKSQLEEHFPDFHCFDAESLRSSACPNGGTWERLIFISELAQDNYVIQVDSDTLTLSDIAEVRDCITANRSFALGTAMGRLITPMREACFQMEKVQDTHVQVLAEQNFCKLSNYEELQYVRACSGFAGFAKGSISRAKVERLSNEMTNILGKKWSEWGSEQVTSNICIANSPYARVLPYPKYANFSPGISWWDSVFLHFIGTYRFKHGVYRRKAKTITRRLQCA